MSSWELVGRLEVSILSVSITSPVDLLQMVSERYDSSDRKIAGDGKSPKNNQEDDLDGFLEGFGAEFSPLDMLQRLSKMVSSNHSNPHPPMKFSHNGYSLLILHQGRKDELMAFVFHKEREEDVKEESVKVDDKGQKVRESGICESQVIDQEENWKYQEDYPNVMEKERFNVSIMDNNLLQKNKERGRQNRKTLGKRKTKKGKKEKEIVEKRENRDQKKKGDEKEKN